MQTLSDSVNASVTPLGFLFSAEDCPLKAGDVIFGKSQAKDDASTTSNTVTDASAAENSCWTPSLSASLYKIDKWGPPYFFVNSSGNISVRPHGSSTHPHQEIDLLKIVKNVTDPKSFGGLALQLPLIIRLPDVLKDRLESINSAFQRAIQSHGYQSDYQGVYPVKSNHDRFIVEDIVRFGFSFRFGLEAGSKAELLLAMTCLCEGNPEAFFICNGHKDSEYISLALIARRLALNTFIVLEQEEETDIIIERSKKLGIRPVIGVRAKLRTKHSGLYGSASGEKGKFGLTTAQILKVVRKLEKVGMLECLQLLHFHIGSQIPSTTSVNDGVREATQIYCELVRLGAHMQVIDIGGGLGIDYDGSKSNHSDLSVGYTIDEYAATVVQAIRHVCDVNSIKHPVICSESGRAIVSHHSILIFEVISSDIYEAPILSASELQHLVDGLSEDARADYHNLSRAAVKGDYETCLYHTEQLKQRCFEQFNQGSFSIEQLAAVDGLFGLVQKAASSNDPVRPYHANLSVFASIPESVGVGQLFPIVPIHRLDERPTVRGILSDLTCDGGGKIDKFIGEERSLPLHELKDDDVGKYCVGMFLGGAYQESIGGLHNLFGGPTVVRVLQTDNMDRFTLTHAMPGLSCGNLLEVMQYKPQLMLETLKHRVQQFVEEENGDQSVASASELATQLARSFNNMPYLVPSSLEE
ncbi:arginine decarboxylase-like [Neltuma alba]|uniref:arginine decarboxylase-like n=1 Tax=Neltuma alba TaxID=207710 RepID=UPI0010A483CF|nr:arginine decarboxylase-like [Prosopis alba]